MTSKKWEVMKFEATKLEAGSHKLEVFPESDVIKLLPCSTQLSKKFLVLIRIKILRNSAFLGSDKPRMLFFPLIHVKMPTMVGILTFMSRKDFMLS